MLRRKHERLEHLGRRESDRRRSVIDNRRVLLVGPNETARLLPTYLFEEAGYAAYAAADGQQAVALAERLCPDIVVVQTETSDMLDTLVRLLDTPSTWGTPVVVLTSSLRSTEACRARALGAVTLLAHSDDGDALVGEVDTLIAAAPHAQRALKRRLLDLRELAKSYAPDAEGQARIRRLIDRLQAAVLAVDEQGHCIAASQGTARLTGYSRLQLLTTSVFQAVFAAGDLSETRWRGFVLDARHAGTTTMTNHAGEAVTVYAATVAELLPGFHVAAFAATDSREARRPAESHAPREVMPPSRVRAISSVRSEMSICEANDSHR
jgi:PAS domain S-box-containing protein